MTFASALCILCYNYDPIFDCQGTSRFDDSWPLRMKLIFIVTLSVRFDSKLISTFVFTIFGKGKQTDFLAPSL